MADIFDTADIVVCLSKDAINRQFAALAAESLLPNRLCIYRTEANGNYTYTSAADAAQVPPSAPSIVANVQPEIDIPATGTTAVLVIRFLKGSTANFRFPDDASGRLYAFDMEGWSYGVAINADLTSYGKGQFALPPSVDAELRHFSEEMFDIRHIFLDLDSVDRKSPDPATTHVSDPRPGVHDAFVSFMEFYLIDLKAGKNPFILGSALLTTPQTVFRDAAGQSTQVPDLLKPAGVSFSLFHDPDYPGRSCLCYALVTRGGHQTVSGSPPNLIANPIKKDGIDGVIAFSHAVFLEPVILEPVYLQIRDKVRAQVQQTLTLDDSEYGGGFPSVLTKQPYGTWEPPHVFSWLDGPQPLKWSYPVASASHDDDRYGNSYTVTVVPSGSAEQLQFSGSIYVFKQHTTSLGFLGKAQAWASATIQWSSTVTIGVADSGTGVEIKATTTPMWQQSSRHSGHNVGASLVDIANAIANLCTGIANPASLPNIFSDMFEHPVSGIGSVGVAVGALGAVVGTSFVMPAGSVFSARNPQIDAMGNYQLELTVRPSIQGALS